MKSLGVSFQRVAVAKSANVLKLLFCSLICPNVPLSVAPLRAATGASSDGALRAAGTSPEAAAAHGARRGQGQEDRRQLQLCDGQVGPGRRRRQVREQRSVIYEGEKIKLFDCLSFPWAVACSDPTSQLTLVQTAEITVRFRRQFSDSTL